MWLDYIIRWKSPNGAFDQSEAARAEIWHKLLQIAQTNFQNVLVVGLIPNVEDRYPCTGWDDKTLMWHFNQDIQDYNAMIQMWCDQQKITFLDVYSAWAQRDFAVLMEDGGHPNGAGHALFCEQVLGKLEVLGWVK